MLFKINFKAAFVDLEKSPKTMAVIPQNMFGKLLKYFELGFNSHIFREITGNIQKRGAGKLK